MNVTLIFALLSIFIILFVYSVFSSELIKPLDWLPEAKKQFSISLWWTLFLEISLPTIIIFISLYVIQICALKANANKLLFPFFPLIFINKLVSSKLISNKQYISKIIVDTIFDVLINTLLIFQLFLSIANEFTLIIFIAFVFNFLLLNIPYIFRIYYVVKAHKNYVSKITSFRNGFEK